MTNFFLIMIPLLLFCVDVNLAYKMTRLSMASTTTSASSNNKKLPYESLSHFNVLKKLQVAAPKYKVSLDAEVVALKNSGYYKYKYIFVEPFINIFAFNYTISDIGRGDNFYESTLSSLKRSRIAFQQEGDVEKRIQLDNNFYELMEMGFDRRLAGESIASGRFQPHVSGLKGAGGMVSRFFELNKSRKEQLDELKQTQLENKKGPFKYMPEFLHKYIDYVNSLKIIPKKSEQTRAFAFSAFFSFVVWANQGARSSFMYFVIGNLITMSMLLQRGMPQMKLIPGQRQQAGTWSSMAFTTAVALSLLFIIPSFLAAFFVTAIIPGMDVSARAKAAMIFGLFGNAYLSSFFEVFEDKSKNGYRWNKAVKGYLEPNLEAKLNKKVFGKQPNLDSYHLVPYDPDVDENPYQPKYLDELPGAAPLSGMGTLNQTIFPY